MLVFITYEVKGWEKHNAEKRGDRHMKRIKGLMDEDKINFSPSNFN
jgi:hypothetical protein